MRKVVVNTTPLIALAGIGQLELLHQLYGEIMIPKAVLDELESEPAHSLVLKADWIQKKAIEHPERKDLFRARLHSGEVEVMILSEEESADLVIMDDNTAKKTAKFLGWNVTGTLGILVKAKQDSLIKKVAPLIQSLIDDGFFVDAKTKILVLRNAGEIQEDIPE